MISALIVSERSKQQRKDWDNEARWQKKNPYLEYMIALLQRAERDAALECKVRGPETSEPTSEGREQWQLVTWMRSEGRSWKYGPRGCQRMRTRRCARMRDTGGRKLNVLKSVVIIMWVIIGTINLMRHSMGVRGYGAP